MANLLLITNCIPFANELTLWDELADWKILHKQAVADANPLIESGFFEVVAIYGKEGSQSWIKSELAELSKIDRVLPKVVFLCQSDAPLSEKDYYTAGADLVMPEDQSRELIKRSLLSLIPDKSNASGSMSIARMPAQAPLSPMPSGSDLHNSLEILRDFSNAFMHSLNYREFTSHFILKLREVISVSRIAIFIEVPSGVEPRIGSKKSKTASDRLACIAAVGIPADLQVCFELNRKEGLGKHVSQRGQILRADLLDQSGFYRQDPQIQREFEILGCEVALPITDREKTLGAALIGGRVTGKPFTDSELQLVYHLLEELGFAIKNSWLHEELSASHRLMTDVLETSISGTIVLGTDLKMRHANRAFYEFLFGEEVGPASKGDIEFPDLPVEMRTALHRLAETGEKTDSFFLNAPKSPEKTYRVSLIPLTNVAQKLPQPVMAVVEDFTQIKAAQKIEIESANLKLTALIARRFAHEIRNSLVPLTTHEQLFESEYGNEDFRASLRTALSRETLRIKRFTDQMLYLSQPLGSPTDVANLRTALETAFQQARSHLGIRADLLIDMDESHETPVIRVHRTSFIHAFEEIFLNALQSGGAAPVMVHVSYHQSAPQGAREVHVAIRDSGNGFTEQTSLRATDPFFTTKNTGVGLGLTVARRIVEHHGGRLSVKTREQSSDFDTLIQLPCN